MAHLVLSQIERIEVLRGPQSPLYGSDALGGVINIITRKGQGAPKLTVSGSGGNYGSYAGDFGLSGSSGRADYSLGVFYARTSGVSAASTRYAGNTEADGYRNLSLSGKFGYAVRQNWTSTSPSGRSGTARPSTTSADPTVTIPTTCRTMPPPSFRPGSGISPWAAAGNRR